jgi:hypothetical protein
MKLPQSSLLPHFLLVFVVSFALFFACCTQSIPIAPAAISAEQPVTTSPTPPVVTLHPPVVKPSPPSAPLSIPWYEAKNYVGKQVRVCGSVTDAHWANTSKGKPTFLNIGKPYPDPSQFTVIIWDNNRSKFPQTPEKWYSGKTICVTGIVIDYQGMAEIEVKSPDQIEVQ